MWKLGCQQNCQFFIVKNINQSMNRNSPQPYMEFRFEDTLRQYQPPLRKRVKRSPSPCGQCLRKSYYLTSEQRISRLCDSRRKYHNLSREKALTYSKLKEEKKAICRRDVSQFSDEVGECKQFQVISFWEEFSDEVENQQMGPKSKEEEQSDVCSSLKEKSSIQPQSVKNQPPQIETMEKEVIFQQTEAKEKVLQTDQQVMEEIKVEKQQNYVREYLEYKGGRVKLEGGDKSCYLSTRILTKACRNDTIEKVKERHPYLANSVQKITKVIREKQAE